MTRRYILPGEQLSGELDPYLKALEPAGVTREVLLEYVLYASDGRTSMSTIQKRMEREVLFWFDNIATPVEVSKLVFTCMDAVEDAARVLEPMLVNTIGNDRTGLYVDRFIGDDPIILQATPDDYHASQDHSSARDFQRNGE